MAVRVFCICVLLLAARSSPAQQPPPAQQPQQSSTQPQPAPVPAPAPPPATSDPFLGSNAPSITALYWLSRGIPTMATGKANTNGEPSDLNYQAQAKGAPWVVVTIPIGKLNALHISYFRVQGDGNFTSNSNQIIYGTSFFTGDYLTTAWKLQNAKISLDYLSWPFPTRNGRFRLKTLWEVQATWMSTTVNAPLRSGEVDASGNLIQTSAIGTNWFIFPSFGLGADYHASKNFRFEARASGFAIPHFSTIWDTEASLNYRIGRIELQAGGKAFHFKTSPRGTEYVRDTLAGVFVGLRWYPAVFNR